ncbi:hypothetical protein [Hymenobacter aerilatus]|nr:hypothetical protein [Hymenobacter aerilatus]
MTKIRQFLADAKGSEYVAALTDSTSIGTFYTRHHQPPLNPRET